MSNQLFKMPPWPNYSEEEVSAVSDVLRSGKVNYWSGEICRQFESRFAKFCETNYAIAVANGTVSLELALKALGVGPGDEVITTSRSFFASASCIVAVGATPVFADVDLNSGNISAESIKPLISSRTRAIITVHLAGWPCDMDPIMELAVSNDLFVVEDCAQAHGATYRGRPVGSIGHIGSFSFCTDKIMSLGGEGGMIVTNDKKLWNYMWSYKDHGKSYDAVYNAAKEVGFKWLHESWGSNLRMTEMQGAIGLLQLEKMNEWTRIRNKNAAILIEALEAISCLRVPRVSHDSTHAAYKLYTYLKLGELSADWSRQRIMIELSKMGVPGLSGSCSEIYLEKACTNSSFIPEGRLPNARALGEESLMFLVHPTLSEDDMRMMSEIIISVLTRAS